MRGSAAPGGGRHTLADPCLLDDVKQPVDLATRGDPMALLLWTCKTTRNRLVRRYQRRGQPVIWVRPRTRRRWRRAI